MQILLKIILLNVFWYAAVYFGPQSRLYTELLFGLSLLLAIGNYFVFKVQMRFKAYFLLLIGFLLYGLGQDLLLSIFGFIHYGQGLPPLWLLSMYAAFLCYYDDVFIKFRKMSLVLQILFGAIGGPLAYYGGVKIAGLHIPKNMEVYYLLSVALSWAFFFPLTLKLYARLENQ